VHGRRADLRGESAMRRPRHLEATKRAGPTPTVAGKARSAAPSVVRRRGASARATNTVARDRHPHRPSKADADLNDHRLLLRAAVFALRERAGSGAPPLDRVPDPLAGGRHVEGFHPERRQRIEDRVDDSRQRAHRAGFASAFGAQRIAFGRHGIGENLHVRHRVGSRHAVIHEAAGQVSRLPVVDYLLHQSLAQSLCYATMDLALEADRVDHSADIVDNDITDDFERAGVRVDFDLTDMAAVGIGVVLGCKGAGLIEAILKPWRKAAGLERRFGDIGDANAPVGPGDREIALGEFDTLLSDFF